MSAIAASPGLLRRPLGFWDTTVGKKAVMAVTGFALFGFVVGHLIGNLQVYLGREKLNHYAEMLHSMPGLLWAARLALIAAVGLHIVAAVQLALRQRAARPQRYASKRHFKQASYASRTMYWSGPIILLFVVYHLLHFTFGTTHPQYSPTDVYSNVVIGFQPERWPVVLFYVLAMGALGLHLIHGVWSMFQSLGVVSRATNRALQTFATAVTAFLFLGNISIPLAVLFGLVRL